MYNYHYIVIHTFIINSNLPASHNCVILVQIFERKMGNAKIKISNLDRSHLGEHFRCVKLFDPTFVCITLLGHDLHCTDSIRHPV